MKRHVLLLVSVVALITVWCSLPTTPADDTATPTQDAVAEPTPSAEEQAPEVEEPTEAPAQLPSGAITKEADTMTSLVNRNSKKVGGEHYGTVKLESGLLTFVDGSLMGGSFVIDMTTMTVDDLQGDSQAWLLNHLKGDDFFSVESYPKATLTITEVTALETENSFDVRGDLTIKWITNPISFVATLDEAGTTATAPIVIDRTLWDIKYRSLRFFSDIADKAIEDEITFTVTLTLK